jgi:chromosome segregation ATPase
VVRFLFSCSISQSGLASKERQIADLGAGKEADKRILVAEAEALRLDIASLEDDLGKAASWWLIADSKRADLQGELAQVNDSSAKQVQTLRETITQRDDTYTTKLATTQAEMREVLSSKEAQIARLGADKEAEKRILKAEAEALRVDIAELEADLAKAMDWWITADMRYVSLQESAQNKEGMYVKQLDKMQAEMKVGRVPCEIPDESSTMRVP